MPLLASKSPPAQPKCNSSVSSTPWGKERPLSPHRAPNALCVTQETIMLAHAEAHIRISSSANEPRLLHEFFEHQVRILPEHPAIVCNGEVATYLQLDRLADQIATLLHRRGFGPGSLIALYSAKSLRLFAAMLGVLKAGAGYGPLDTRLPIARIQNILAD